MKLLFTSIGTTGHLHPSLPYALAAQDAGHEVAFASDGLPAWIGDLPPQDTTPRVYITLGTVFEHPGIFEVILDGLKDEPMSVIVTVGRQIDPERFGAQPPNVHIEQYIPQSLLFPHCDLVVCHGGSGTSLSALDHGLPIVMVPLGADQLYVQAGRGCVRHVRRTRQSRRLAFPCPADRPSPDGDHATRAHRLADRGRGNTQ